MTKVPTRDSPWPDAYHPDRAHFHVVNQLQTMTPRELIWRRLIDAHNWHTLYSNAKRVEIKGGRSMLDAGVGFAWTSFSLRLKSEVLACEQERFLAWRATGIGVDAMHWWRLDDPKDGPHQGGTQIVTEETQIGWMARLGKSFIPRNIQFQHQRWLEGLATGRATG